MKNQIIHGDALTAAQSLPDQSVHCIVTSPPYFALRAYHGEQAQAWPAVDYSPMTGVPPIHVPAITCPLGLEPDPAAYVGHIVLIFRELWRILRDDGIAWLNLGDTYAGSGGAGGDYMAGGLRDGQPKYRSEYRPTAGSGPAAAPGLKHKDLIGIPSRAVLALQADGWTWRQLVIWHKPNGMPESAQDRPHRNHEAIYMLTKSRRYYYDPAAVKLTGTGRDGTKIYRPEADGRIIKRENPHSGLVNGTNGAHGRHRRSVWTIATVPYKAAHFATWPPNLIRPMILASTSARGVCPACGGPWQRQAERVRDSLTVEERHGRQGHNGKPPQQSGNYWPGPVSRPTDDWAPTCECKAGEPEPATVYDPFMGSGTTAATAIELGRHYLGSEISAEYIALAQERIALAQPPLIPAGLEITSKDEEDSYTQLGLI